MPYPRTVKLKVTNVLVYWLVSLLVIIVIESPLFLLLCLKANLPIPVVKGMLTKRTLLSKSNTNFPDILVYIWENGILTLRTILFRHAWITTLFKRLLSYRTILFHSLFSASLAEYPITGVALSTSNCTLSCTLKFYRLFIGGKVHFNSSVLRYFNCYAILCQHTSCRFSCTFGF